MRVRALDSSGDWTFGSGLNNYLTGINAVQQTIATRLLMFLGDCFFATDVGIDWFTFLGGSKSQLALQLAINAVILNTDNVTGIVTTSVELDDSTRAFTVNYTVTTAFGNVNGTVTQNLGVGPLAPPVNNLLPQFNQSLLNNVSATAIVGAMFSDGFIEVDLDYVIERYSSAGSYVQRGTLFVIYNADTEQWSIDNVVDTGSSGPSTGVVFTINASTGQVYYASDDLTGTGYVGTLVIGATNIFPGA